jgi:uncharacterized protein (DUF697 family)
MNHFFSSGFDDKTHNDPETVEYEIVNDDGRRAALDRLLRNYVLWAMGAGLIPFPMLDVAAVSALQVDLIKRITEKYRQPVEETQVKAWVGALVGSTGARLAADVLKLIPVVGTVVGGVTQSVLSGATTYALGKVFIRHFESGGTYLNFDPAQFREYFKESLEKGRQYAENLKKKYAEKFQKNEPDPPAPKPAADTQSLVAKLVELKRLFDAGAITADEFAELKSKIIQEI